MRIFNYITRSINRVNVLRSATVGDPLFCSMNTIIQLNQESVCDFGDGGRTEREESPRRALIGDSSQVLYIATSQILDDEMAARIEHHRQGRPEHWRTVERWQHLDD